jgi:DNA ligase-1
MAESLFTETLFKRDSRGSVRVWTVAVYEEGGHGVIRTITGLRGGKQVHSSRTVRSGKNLGKANATTPVTQAVAQAQALVRKRRKEGYASDEDAGGFGEEVEGADASASSSASASVTSIEPPIPMLAKDYQKLSKTAHKKLIDGRQLYAQWKIDGIRCLAEVRADGSVVLTSRTGHRYRHLQHLEKAVAALAVSHGLGPGTVLDGELFTPALPFEEISGVARRAMKDGAPSKGTEQFLALQLWVFDLFERGQEAVSFQERWERLASLGLPAAPVIDRGSGAAVAKDIGRRVPLVIVRTDRLGGIGDLDAFHSRSVESGFEGSIIRDGTASYTHGRSGGLLKKKDFLTEEFPIIGFKEGEGRFEGTVIWECDAAKGEGEVKSFWVTPRGSLEHRRELLLSAAASVGKQLTVWFQERTEGGVPRFPIGLAVRVDV